jgi:hypothetical protein
VQPTGTSDATCTLNCGKSCGGCVQPKPEGEYYAAFQYHPLWHLSRISHRTRGKFDYPYQNAGSGVRAYFIDSGALRFHQEFVEDVASTVGGHLSIARSPRMREEPGSNVIATRRGPDMLPSTAPNTDCAAGTPLSGRLTMGGLYYPSEYPWFLPGDGISDHGTAVASALGGRNVGVAKEVTLIPVKALSCEDRSTTADLIAAINWVYQQEYDYVHNPTNTGQEHRLAVLSISTSKVAHDGNDSGGASRWVNEPALLEAIESALEKLITDLGVPVFVAADNFKRDACTLTPQRQSRRGGRGQVITVGGLAKGSDTQWIKDAVNGSNVGPCVDIIAPSEDIHVAGTTGWSAFREQAFSSGTSYAAPMVAGIAARMMSEDAAYIQSLLKSNPSEVPREIHRRLMASATTLAEPNGALAGEPLGAGSPNRIAYMGAVGLTENPRSFDFNEAPEPNWNLTVGVPAGATIAGYEWWKNSTPDYDYTNATRNVKNDGNLPSSTYQVAAPTVPREYYWARVLVDDPDGRVYTESAMATISNGCAVITQQPASKWEIPGKEHTFTIAVQGASSR